MFESMKWAIFEEIKVFFLLEPDFLCPSLSFFVPLQPFLCTHAYINVCFMQILQDN